MQQVWDEDQDRIFLSSSQARWVLLAFWELLPWELYTLTSGTESKNIQGKLCKLLQRSSDAVILNQIWFLFVFLSFVYCFGREILRGKRWLLTPMSRSSIIWLNVYQCLLLNPVTPLTPSPSTQNRTKPKQKPKLNVVSYQHLKS